MLGVYAVAIQSESKWMSYFKLIGQLAFQTTKEAMMMFLNLQRAKGARRWVTKPFPLRNIRAKSKQLV